MGYIDTTGVIIYCNPGHNFVIHRYHHVWFDEHNCCLSIEDKQNPGYLPIQQYPESIIHNSDLLKLIPCTLDITSNPFSNTTMIKNEIELSPSGKKIGFNLLDDENFTIPMPLIQYQINQPVINFQQRLNEMCRSLLPTDKILSQIKVHLINSISTKLHV